LREDCLFENGGLRIENEGPAATAMYRPSRAPRLQASRPVPRLLSEDSIMSPWANCCGVPPGLLATDSKMPDLHRELGLATADALSIWCVALWVPSLTRWAFPVGVLAIVLLVLAGFFGGIIAHG
jgi:hypothetical protein